MDASQKPTIRRHVSLITLVASSLSVTLACFACWVFAGYQSDQQQARRLGDSASRLTQLLRVPLDRGEGEVVAAAVAALRHESLLDAAWLYRPDGKVLGGFARDHEPAPRLSTLASAVDSDSGERGVTEVRQIRQDGEVVAVLALCSSRTDAWNGWGKASLIGAIVLLPVAQAVLLGSFLLLRRVSGPSAERGEDHGEALRQADERNRQRIAQLNGEFRLAQEKAESASLSKSQFLAAMSHEIRSPMNGVLGVVELLFKTPLNPKQREYVEVIRNSGSSLLVILNEILDFSKLEAGKLSLEIIDFDPRAVAETALELFAGRAQLKCIELALEIDPKIPDLIQGDPCRLRQVLTNLLDNAVKFTEHGGVCLVVSLDEVCDNDVAWSMRVTDSGIGIAPQKQGELFHSFSQADASTNRRYGGSGLGLAISKHLVELMGGIIRMESQPGRGSTFIVQLRSNVSPEAQVARTVPAWERSRSRVLVVEPGAVQRQALCHQLEMFGATAEPCSSGREALERVRADRHGSSRYQLVLIDLQLADADGLNLAKTIWDDPVLHQDRVVVMTAFGDTTLRATEDMDGVDALLTKPIRPSLLEEVLFAEKLGRLDLSSSAGGSLPSIPPGHALLVEDSYTNRILCQEMLEVLGWTSDVASNGYEAVEAVQAREFDVILMDCMMPGMDGFQATRAIRQGERDGGHASRPIIAITANAMEGEREKCLAAGMDDYVSKPFTLSRLTEALCASQELFAERGFQSTGAGRSETGSSASDCEAEVIDEHALQPIRQLEQAGRVGLLERVLEQFKSESVQVLADLRESCRAADAEATRRAAHTLKSASAHVGALRLSRMCRDIEAQAQKGSTREARLKLGTLDTEYQKVCRALERLSLKEVSS